VLKITVQKYFFFYAPQRDDIHWRRIRICGLPCWTNYGLVFVSGPVPEAVNSSACHPPHPCLPVGHTLGEQGDRRSPIGMYMSVAQIAVVWINWFVHSCIEVSRNGLLAANEIIR